MKWSYTTLKRLEDAPGWVAIAIMMAIGLFALGYLVGVTVAIILAL